VTASGLRAHPESIGARFAPVLFPHDRRSGESSTAAAHILIVEDDFLAATEIEAVLVEAGYGIAGIANRAEQALELVRSQAPALVIMDVRLAGRVDGVEAALEIFRATGIRCIFATAHHDANVRARAQAAAPLGWLPKPYAPHALIAMVKRALAEM
jgi:two-component system, response regulator PdtaR